MGREPKKCGVRVGVLWASEVGHGQVGPLWTETSQPPLGQVTDLLPVTYATNLHVWPPTQPAKSEHGLFLVLGGCDKQLPVFAWVKCHLHPCWLPAQRTIWGPSWHSHESLPLFFTTARFNSFLRLVLAFS